MDHKRRNRRSVVFYSAVQPERWDEAITSGADMVCFDMEDGTAADRKDEARRVCLPLYARDPGRPMVRLLRINSPRSDDGVRDLLALVALDTPPDGIVIPKVSSAEEVRWVADILAARHPAIELVVLIETQEGLDGARAIARAAPQVSCMFLGHADLSGELGSDMSVEALHHARSRIVIAASEAGIDAMDGPYFEPDDVDGLVRETRLVAAMGFTGKSSYDAGQIPHIHAAFTPSATAIDHARRVVAAVADSPTGVARVDGRSVNKANLKTARRILATATRRGVL